MMRQTVPKRSAHLRPPKDVYENVHTSIHNSQHLETTQTSVDRRMDWSFAVNQKMEYYVTSNLNELNTYKCNDMGESHRHYVE